MRFNYGLFFLESVRKEGKSQELTLSTQEGSSRSGKLGLAERSTASFRHKHAACQYPQLTSPMNLMRTVLMHVNDYF